MAKTYTLQTSFASGEVTPFIYGRVDRDIYYNGAAKLRNVYVTPLGGVIRRGGTEKIDSTTNNARCRMISFQFNVIQTYLLVFAQGEFKVYKNGVLQATVTSSPISNITASMLPELNWTQSADTLIIVHPDLKPIRITRTSDTNWTAVEVTFSNIPAFDFGSGTEAVWSTSRGWPRSVTFWQQRLWFGGSKSRPQTVWGSRIAGFFNFSFGTGADDDAIEFTIDDDEVNAIVNIFAGRTLQVLTTGGEFFTPISVGTAVTPKTISLEKATRHGSANVRPFSTDGATIFVQRGGQTIREYVFLDLEQSYIAEDISFLSSHLIRNPVSAAIQRSNNLSGEYSYFVNQDGTMAVLNRRRSQNFIAWTLFETKGKYEDVAVVGNDVYVSVLREIDGADVRFIEKFDESLYVDAGVVLSQSPANATWDNLDYLEGETVNVRASDGSPLLSNMVVDGEIETERPELSIQVGIPFTPIIRILSPEDAGSRSLSGKRRRIVSSNFNLNKSNGFTVLNERESSIATVNSFGNVTFNQPLPKITGWRKIYNRGYSRQPYIEVRQENPIDLHILSVSIEVTI
jgi:hypothetical protein